MSKNKIAKLRQKLREAEEAGFNTALCLMQEFVADRMDAELTHRPDSNIYKRTISETWTQISRKINQLRNVI